MSQVESHCHRIVLIVIVIIVVVIVIVFVKKHQNCHNHHPQGAKMVVFPVVLHLHLLDGNSLRSHCQGSCFPLLQKGLN